MLCVYDACLKYHEHVFAQHLFHPWKKGLDLFPIDKEAQRERRDPGSIQGSIFLLLSLACKVIDAPDNGGAKEQCIRHGPEEKMRDSIFRSAFHSFVSG